LLGEDAFQEGIQEYIKTYQNSNADWNELVAILDKKSAGDIKSWSDVWVNSSGRPIFSEEIEYNEKGNVSKFIIHQRAEDGSDKIWTQSFSITLMDERGYQKNINIKNIGKSFEITAAVKDFKPGQVLYNSNGFGYGIFPIYKDKIHAYKDIKDTVSRGYQFINLYENMLNGNVSVNETYTVFLEAIKTENNELITNFLSSKIEQIYWTFLTEKQQKVTQQITESTLLKLLESDVPSNIKKTVFDLYQSIAISEEGKSSLYQIWNEEKMIKNLFLNENEFTSLAFDLAIYQHPKSDKILDKQVKNITNPDRLESFQWLLPSVSNDEKVRDDFMQSLLQKENREKESWVETALNNMHHPLRQQKSVKHLKSVLYALEEVQLTGDIFFPKGWLASSIGKYSSKEAYQVLEDFLKENPTYNPILLKKLLQTTDDLTRAQSIKK
ncbi:MAG: aminopeptidase N, partial [Maribacter sp.]